MMRRWEDRWEYLQLSTLFKLCFDYKLQQCKLQSWKSTNLLETLPFAKPGCSPKSRTYSIRFFFFNFKLEKISQSFINNLCLLTGIRQKYGGDDKLYQEARGIRKDGQQTRQQICCAREVDNGTVHLNLY